jgi:hypothetical protein
MKNIVGFIYWGESKGGWRYDNYPFAFLKELNVSLYLYTFPTKLKKLGDSKLWYFKAPIPKEWRKHRQKTAQNQANCELQTHLA